MFSPLGLIQEASPVQTKVIESKLVKETKIFSLVGIPNSVYLVTLKGTFQNGSSHLIYSAEVSVKFDISGQAHLTVLSATGEEKWMWIEDVCELKLIYLGDATYSGIAFVHVVSSGTAEFAIL